MLNTANSEYEKNLYAIKIKDPAAYNALKCHGNAGDTNFGDMDILHCN